MSGQGSASTLDLSEQQLVSCVNLFNSPYDGYGCNSGWVHNVRRGGAVVVLPRCTQVKPNILVGPTTT
jgi:hypothetical protein